MIGRRPKRFRVRDFYRMQFYQSLESLQTRFFASSFGFFFGPRSTKVAPSRPRPDPIALGRPGVVQFVQPFRRNLFPSRRSVMSAMFVWPVLISAVVLFFASFLSWMVLQLHKNDWRKLPAEEEVMSAIKKAGPSVGSYMFPHCGGHAEMQTEAFQAKYKAGPNGIVTILAPVNMGQNLGLTFLYFLAVSFGLAYLTSIAFPSGASFLDVFRFVFTAAFMTFLAGIVQHAIWFRPRITGHVIESVGYAALTGFAFASLWPAA
jgi:hypothetical protein